jgi:uncharacterized protein (DUF2342 family)
MKPSEHPVMFAASIGGCFGLIAAIVIAFFIPFLPIHNTLLLVLWPTCILGISDLGNSDIGFKLFIAVLEFGGNALIYAFVASLPVWLYLRIKEFINPENRNPISIFRK